MIMRVTRYMLCISSFVQVKSVLQQCERYLLVVEVTLNIDLQASLTYLTLFYQLVVLLDPFL